MAERSPDEIKRDIERSRAQLASSIDQLTYRTNPKRLVESGKKTVVERLQTPQGQAVAGAAGGLVVLLVVLRIRNGRKTKKKR